MAPALQSGRIPRLCRRRAWPAPTLASLALWVAALAPRPAAGQDVELLGTRYGTRPPPAYYREMERSEDAYRFTRGRAGRARAIARAGARAGGAASSEPAPLRGLGQRDGPVVGTFAVPVVLGLFQDSPDEPFDREDLEDAYFGSGAGTVTAFYDEVSGGRVTLEGHVFGWAEVGLTRQEVTRDDAALSRSTPGEGGIGNFVYELVQAIIDDDPSIDWGAFDNDGPDGKPNSGDDDGFVDALAVIHPTRGAECFGTYDLVWSHKWSLVEALGGSASDPSDVEALTVETPTPSASGGRIRVDDYFVQAGLSCDSGASSETTLNEIGIFAHEAGHAFGLPDLYDTRSAGVAHAGAGNWDLMATGAWGCDGASPATPCHMGAWSKEMLGWVDVVELDPGEDHETLVLPPVVTDGTVFRVDAQDGSGEYFLLEVRTREGFDENLPSEGLLVWQVDPALVLARWPANRVNSSDMPGVRLRQADGRDDLGRPGGGRGDAGDPFPLVESGTGRAFHAGSNPAADSYLGTATGLTLLDIRKDGDGASFHALTRFTELTLEAVGAAPSAPLFRTEGGGLQPSGATLSVAPFETVRIEAAAGEPLGPGVRRPFVRWEHDGSRVRIRDVVAPLEDLVLTAAYEGRQVELAVSLSGSDDGIVPGTLHSTPASADLWYAEGDTVSIEARARNGFAFAGWSGALEGRPNPAEIVMSEPVAAGASFSIVFAVAPVDEEIPAAAPRELALNVLHGSTPVTWSLVGGALPEGMRLRSSGRITGEAIEMGTFEASVEARDAIGLRATGTVRIVVGPPDIEPARAAAPFLLAREGLSEAEKRFLDRAGNADGRYDLGDLRAWIRTLEGAGGGS